MRWKVVSVFALVAILATSAYAGGEKCTQDTQTCLNHMAGAAATKGWLGIDKEKTADGYKVTKVTPGGPAEKAGIQVGDLIVAINGMAIGSEELKNAGKDMYKVGATLKYTVQRSGKPADLQVTLAKTPDDVFAAQVGTHMLEHANLQSAAK